jgi:hypothetical protein
MPRKTPSTLFRLLFAGAFAMAITLVSRGRAERSPEHAPKANFGGEPFRLDVTENSNEDDAQGGNVRHHYSTGRLRAGAFRNRKPRCLPLPQSQL